MTHFVLLLDDGVKLTNHQKDLLKKADKMLEKDLGEDIYDSIGGTGALSISVGEDGPNVDFTSEKDWHRLIASDGFDPDEHYLNASDSEKEIQDFLNENWNKEPKGGRPKEEELK